MKNKIIKDALALTLITLVAGVALGGVYEITKDPIAKQEAQAKAEAYEQVFTDAAAFEEVEMDDTLIQTIRDQLDQEGYKAQSIEEVMRAEDQSGETLGYAFTVVTSEGYGGDIQFSMGVQNDGTLNGISILSIGETAGLGMNADTPAFKDQFVGKQVEKLIKGQNPFLWIESLWKGRNMKAKIGVEYDESALKTQIANLECMKEENQIAPVNAHPEFKTDKFVVVPETDGTTIKTEEFRKAVITAVNGANEKLDLLKTGCYEKPAYTSDSKKVTEACDAMNKYLGATVTYDFKPNTEVVDSSMISKWVKVDDDMNVTFDESAVKEYVQSLAAKYDTKGKKRTFTSASGNTVTVSGGSYGWKIDQEAEYNALIANIQKAETVTREPNYSSRAASHDGNDVGNTYAELNLTTQHMYYVKDGHIALETDVVTGNPNKGNATPTGVYSLAYKAKDQTLRGTKKADGTYEYETPVKYWMPFNGGVGFHDASWQPTFGGSRYQTNGSHGCVNMPPEMAGKLFELISAGAPVVVHN